MMVMLAMMITMKKMMIAMAIIMIMIIIIMMLMTKIIYGHKYHISTSLQTKDCCMYNRMIKVI